MGAVESLRGENHPEGLNIPTRTDVGNPLVFVYLVAGVCILSVKTNYTISSNLDELAGACETQYKVVIQPEKLDLFQSVIVLLPEYSQSIFLYTYTMELDKTMEIGFFNLFLQYFQSISIPWKTSNFSRVIDIVMEILYLLFLLVVFDNRNRHLQNVDLSLLWNGAVEIHVSGDVNNTKHLAGDVNNTKHLMSFGVQSLIFMAPRQQIMMTLKTLDRMRLFQNKSQIF